MMVTKQPGDAAPAELDMPGFVEAIRIGRQTGSIAEESNVQSPAQDAFVRAKPLEAFLNRYRKSFIGNRTFRRPKARGLDPEDPLMVFAGAPELLSGILRMTKSSARKRRRGIRHAGDVRIAKQRKNGMVERRGAELDLAAGCRLAINRQNHAKKLELFFLQGGFIRLGEVLPLRSQPDDHRVFFEPFFVHPRKLRENLEVAPVARRKRYLRAGAAGGTRQFVQFDETRPAGHQVVVVELKSARENLRLVLESELVDILESEGEPRLLEIAAGVFLKLRPERGNHVKRDVKFRESLEDPNHSPVVFQRVEAGPRKNVVLSLRVAVLRLMHVPKQNEMNAVHQACRSREKALGMLHSRFASCASWIVTSSAKFFVMRSSASPFSPLFSSCLSWYASWNCWSAIRVPAGKS